LARLLTGPQTAAAGQGLLAAPFQEPAAANAGDQLRPGLLHAPRSAARPCRGLGQVGATARRRHALGHTTMKARPWGPCCDHRLPKARHQDHLAAVAGSGQAGQQHRRPVTELLLQLLGGACKPGASTPSRRGPKQLEGAQRFGLPDTALPPGQASSHCAPRPAPLLAPALSSSLQGRSPAFHNLARLGLKRSPRSRHNLARRALRKAAAPGRPRVRSGGCLRATALSPEILNRTDLAVFGHVGWPPQSSIEPPGTSTTRTVALYFSRNIGPRLRRPWPAPAPSSCTSIAVSRFDPAV